MFQPRSGLLVTARLRLLYPLKNGYRVSEAEVDTSAPAVTWVADHLGLGIRVEVTFASPLASPAGAADTEATSEQPGVAAGGPLARAAAAFQARALVSAQINEPHVVRILEQGNVKGLPFIVTELLEGKSLRQRLLHGSASLEDVHTLVSQTCEALARAHALGIAHGNLRPDQLYLIDVADQPFVKIAGFGAQPTVSDGIDKNAYASPEQLLHDKRGDARSDLWALAVSVYELLTTILPFEAATAAGVTVAICNAQFALPSQYRADLPSGIDGWFSRALAKDLGRRFSSAPEFARTFEQALTSGSFATEASIAAPLSTLLAGSQATALEPSDPSSATPTPPMPVVPAALPQPPATPAAHAKAEDDSLEMDPGEEDEKTTVKWDAPSERLPTRERAPAAILPSIVPNPLGGSANRVSAAIPGVASARQGAITQRIVLPPALASRTPRALGSAPPALEPGVYMDSPYIASVASALAVPSTVLAPEAVPQRFFTPDKTWLAALAFAAGVAVTWFAYDPQPEGEGVMAAGNAEVGPDGIRTISVDDLPSVSADGTRDDGDLPAIIQPSQLPRVTDDASEPGVVAPPPSPVGERRATVQRVQALTPSPAKAAPPARPKPSPVASTSAPARATCTPPYSIDSQGIQRLKPECLDSPPVIAGPYGAVMTTHAPPAAELAAPAKPISPAAPSKPSSAAGSGSAAPAKPAAPHDHQARSSATCTPPYYIEGKIRRLKLECL